MIQFVEQSVKPLGIAPSNEPEMLKVIELAGRTAYKSEDKITPESAVKFVQMLKKLGHLSVLEHSNIVFQLDRSWEQKELLAALYKRIAYHPTVFGADSSFIGGNVRAWIETLATLSHYSWFWDWFAYGLHASFPHLFSNEWEEEKENWGSSPTIDTSQFCLVPEHKQLDMLRADPETDLPVFVFKIVCDRGISHEIVRHRVFSFTQESTRYVNYGGKGLILIKPEEYDPELIGVFNNAENVERDYEYLLNDNIKPQIARDVLPNLLKTELVVSGRWSGWRNFIELRDTKAAHPRIQKIGCQVREYFEDLSLTV